MNEIGSRGRHTLDQGFTLIEIMVVVVIIGILAAMVLPKVVGRIGDAEIRKAKHDIAVLDSAVEMYRLDNLDFPSNEYGLSALVDKPDYARVKNWPDGGYLKRLSKDPWGNAYQYRYPGNHGEFDIYSNGRDGRPGGDQLDADIGNWDLE